MVLSPTWWCTRASVPFLATTFVKPLGATLVSAVGQQRRFWHKHGLRRCLGSGNLPLKQKMTPHLMDKVEDANHTCFWNKFSHVFIWNYYIYSLYIIIIRYSVFWEWSVLSVVSGWNFHQFFHLFALPQGGEIRHWYLHDNDGAQARIFDGWSGAATQNPQPKLAKNQEHAPRGQGDLIPILFPFFLVNLQNILPVTRSDPLAKCYVNVNVMSPKINYLCPKGFLKLGGGWNWDIEKGMNNIITIKSVGYVL